MQLCCAYLVRQGAAPLAQHWIKLHLGGVILGCAQYLVLCRAAFCFDLLVCGAHKSKVKFNNICLEVAQF